MSRDVTSQGPELIIRWNSLYPIYFDAKVSIAKGRRVPREYALWWPQAQHLSIACRNLGLQSCLEVSKRRRSRPLKDKINRTDDQPTRTHPADFENPGRVKVLFKENGKYLNPIIKNRTSRILVLLSLFNRCHPSSSYTRGSLSHSTNRADEQELSYIIN